MNWHIPRPVAPLSLKRAPLKNIFNFPAQLLYIRLHFYSPNPPRGAAGLEGAEMQRVAERAHGAASRWPALRVHGAGAAALEGVVQELQHAQRATRRG